MLLVFLFVTNLAAQGLERVLGPPIYPFVHSPYDPDALRAATFVALVLAGVVLLAQTHKGKRVMAGWIVDILVANVYYACTSQADGLSQWTGMVFIQLWILVPLWITGLIYLFLVR